jgi:hypothetical protein
MRITYGLAVAATVLSCTPGELSEDEAQDFRKQLTKYYPPETEESSSEDETDTPEPTAMPEETEPAPTPSMPEVNPEPTDTSETGAGDTTVIPDETTAEDTTAEDTTAEDTMAAGGGEFDPCVTEILQNSCAGSFCHYGSEFNQTPDYSRADLFGLLTTETPSFCTSATNEYVDLDAPLESYILQKVRGQQPAGCGDRMPPASATALTNEQLDCLENWFGSLAN